MVERTFTDAQIREAGGVSEAFEDFEREMEDAGQSVNVEISLSSSRRRRSDNRYVFSVFFRSNSGFSEEEVLGDLVSMYREKNANNSEDFGIELTDSAYQEGADSIKSELERAVSMELSYPDDVEFVAVGSFFLIRMSGFGMWEMKYLFDSSRNSLCKLCGQLSIRFGDRIAI